VSWEEKAGQNVQFISAKLIGQYWLIEPEAYIQFSKMLDSAYSIKDAGAVGRFIQNPGSMSNRYMTSADKNLGEKGLQDK
jgi:hypothetical protein